ncbi:MAG: DUF624 domain-containing protein [Bacillota bacterium]
MAGFFSFFDYTKPGPGIPENAPPKPRIVIFFNIFLCKFWHLVKLNMLFLLFNLPAVIVMPLVAQFFLPMLNKGTVMTGNSIYELMFYFAAGAILVCIPVVTAGPAQAGFTYVLRNFSREEHAFLWGDFKEHAVKNVGQSSLICLIDLVVVLIIGIDISFYMRISEKNMLQTAATFFVIIFFIIYVMMHMYIYPMLITFRLSVKQIYKNAFIFSIIRFFPNLGILALCSVLALLPLLLLPAVGILMFLFITMSLIGLLTNFYVYPVLKKHMLDKLPDMS